MTKKTLCLLLLTWPFLCKGEVSAENWADAFQRYQTLVQELSQLEGEIFTAIREETLAPEQYSAFQDYLVARMGEELASPLKLHAMALEDMGDMDRELEDSAPSEQTIFWDNKIQALQDFLARHWEILKELENNPEPELDLALTIIAMSEEADVLDAELVAAEEAGKLNAEQIARLDAFREAYKKQVIRSAW